MRSSGNRLEARQVRSLVNRFKELQAAPGNHFGSGFINENGKPSWEDSSPEEGHEFRKYVYEVLRVREQT